MPFSFRQPPTSNWHKISWSVCFSVVFCCTQLEKREVPWNFAGFVLFRLMYIVHLLLLTVKAPEPASQALPKELILAAFQPVTAKVSPLDPHGKKEDAPALHKTPNYWITHDCLTYQLVSWCFESSQPQRITSGLNTNFIPSPSY